MYVFNKNESSDKKAFIEITQFIMNNEQMTINQIYEARGREKMHLKK